jgi:peptide deformylase
MLKIFNENHPLLASKIPLYEGDFEPLKKLATNMFALMWLDNGIGLAANQVGIAVRMFVMGPEKGPHYICINPEIVDKSEKLVKDKEGCLSSPGLWLNINREEWVHAKYMTLNGEVVERKFEGLLARCYLHELDHLNGISFTSLSSKLGLQLAREKQNKILRKRNKNQIKGNGK